MVDDGGNFAVRVELGIHRVLLFARLEVEVLGLVCETELLEDYGDLPGNR